MQVINFKEFKSKYIAFGLFLFCLVGTKNALAEGIDSCMRFSLDSSFASIAVGDKSPLFVRCASSNSEPVNNQVRPKYSQYEVKAMADNYAAVMDCLEIDPTMLFPKLMAESGFHTLIQNPNGDAGIGQLTKKAILDVEANMDFFKQKISESQKPSCRKIKSFASARREFWLPIANKSKCSVMNRNLNPMKNILYTGIFHKLNQRYVNQEINRLQVVELLIRAGYPSDNINAIKDLMVTLGYNTGGAVAVRNLRDYLISRIDFIDRKMQEFSPERLMQMPDPERRTILRFINDKDFDFTSSTEKFKERKDLFRQELARINPRMDKDSLEKLVHLKMRNESASTYTFPEWLFVWQSHGGPGYLSSLAKFASRLDKQFGVGVCSNAGHYKVGSLETR